MLPGIKKLHLECSFFYAGKKMSSISTNAQTLPATLLYRRKQTASDPQRPVRKIHHPAKQ